MKFARLFIGLFLFIAFAGCSPREEKIDGSVFIVTKSGENIKLGLVAISIFDQQQIESCNAITTAYLKKNRAELEKSKNDLENKRDSLEKTKADLEKDEADLEDKSTNEIKQQQERIREKYNNAILARDALKLQYEKAKDLADETLESMGGDLTRPEFTGLDETNLEAYVWYSEHGDSSLRASMQEEAQKLESKKKTILEMQSKWDSSHERLYPDYLKQVSEEDRLRQEWQKTSDESDGYTNSQEVLEAKLAELVPRLEGQLTNQKLPLDAQLEPINDELKTVTDELQTIRDELQSWYPQPQLYFGNLPTPIALAKTDADGKFLFQLPTKGEFFLVAQAQREVSDKTEEYFWLVRVHSDGKSEMQVMLSNDNLITANSSNVAVQFPAP